MDMEKYQDCITIQKQNNSIRWNPKKTSKSVVLSYVNRRATYKGVKTTKPLHLVGVNGLYIGSRDYFYCNNFKQGGMFMIGVTGQPTEEEMKAGSCVGRVTSVTLNISRDTDLMITIVGSLLSIMDFTAKRVIKTLDISSSVGSLVFPYLCICPGTESFMCDIFNCQRLDMCITNQNVITFKTMNNPIVFNTPECCVNFMQGIKTPYIKACKIDSEEKKICFVVQGEEVGSMSVDGLNVTKLENLSTITAPSSLTVSAGVNTMKLTPLIFETKVVNTNRVQGIENDFSLLNSVGNGITISADNKISLNAPCTLSHLSFNAAEPVNVCSIASFKSSDVRKAVILPSSDSTLCDSPEEGMIMYDTVQSKFLGYNGVEWVVLG